jgi:hypothetical protein
MTSTESDKPGVAADLGGQSVSLGSQTLPKFAPYIATRVGVTSAAAATVGASVGYYAGTGIYFPLYAYGITSGLLAGSFFGVNYALRSLRGKDSWENFAIAGALHGAALGVARKNPRVAVIGSVVGGIAGSLYDILSDNAYNTARDLWILNRRYVIEHSKPRILVTPRSRGDYSRFPAPPPNGADVPTGYYGRR